MEENINVSALIEKLRTGEKIKCLKCKKGIYVTKQEYLNTSHNFWCDKCGDLLHVISSKITVE